MDNGNSWKTIGLKDQDVKTIVVNSDVILAGGFFDGVICSHNGGTSWETVQIADKYFVESLLLSSGSYILVGTSQGVFKSKDNGTTWFSCNIGDHNIRALSENLQGHIFAGTRDGKMFRSTDAGNSWFEISVGLQAKNINCIAIDSMNRLYVSAENGLFKSTENGESWSKVNLPEAWVTCLLIAPGDMLLIGGMFEGIKCSMDYGDTWTMMSSGMDWSARFAYPHIECLAMDAKGNIYAGASGNGLFRTTIDAVEQLAKALFDLKQQYEEDKIGISHKVSDAKLFVEKFSFVLHKTFSNSDISILSEIRILLSQGKQVCLIAYADKQQYELYEKPQ